MIGKAGVNPYENFFYFSYIDSDGLIKLICVEMIIQSLNFLDNDLLPCVFIRHNKSIISS